LLTLSHEFTNNLTLTDTDLLISNMHPAPHETVLLTATVRNSGDLALDNVTVTFYDADPATPDARIPLQARVLPEPLPAGFTATFTATYTPPTWGGARLVLAVADPADLITEGDETDNTATLLAMGPDLAIAGATVDYWGGTDVSLRTSVQNLGTRVSPSATLAIYREGLTGTLVLTTGVAPLDVGQAFTPTLPWNFAGLSAGEHTLVAIVNQNSLSETFTANNILTFSLDVRCDIAVSPLYVWADEPTAGSVPVTVTVFNFGPITATDVVVGFYVDETGLLSGTQALTRSIGVLPPGSAATVSGNVPGPLETLYVLADPEFALAETSRANNLAFRQMLIPPPGVPTLLAPPNGTITGTQVMVFNWAPAAGDLPIGYNVQLDGSWITTTATTSSTILATGVHTWTVRAFNEGGYSDWTAPWVLTVTEAVPGVPTLLAPPNGAVTTTNNVTLMWQAGAGGTPSGYNVQLDGATITTTGTTSATLLSVGVYTWTVRAYNAGGYSGWAAPWTVEIIPLLPALSIAKSGPANVRAGERITYTLTVTNSGTGTATGLVISDTLPTGASYIGGGTLVGNVVRWTAPSLTASGGVTVTQFVVTATQTITNSSYRVTADGGVSATGSVSVVTLISGHKIYLPVVLRQ
jgi:uncharacterized repeat protein (TIGR01451 family)